MGIDLKAAVEGLLKELVEEKKAKAKRCAEELRRAMRNSHRGGVGKRRQKNKV